MTLILGMPSKLRIPLILGLLKTLSLHEPKVWPYPHQRKIAPLSCMNSVLHWRKKRKIGAFHLILTNALDSRVVIQRSDGQTDYVYFLSVAQSYDGKYSPTTYVGILMVLTNPCTEQQLQLQRCQVTMRKNRIFKLWSYDWVKDRK